MENPAEVQELRNKLRMMKFPQDEILNTVRRQQRAIHKQKQANETIRNEIVEYETQLANIDREISLHKSNEELQKLQTERKRLTNKLSNLTADKDAEEAKRKRIEEEVSKANSKAGGFFQQSRENEELQARLRTMENRLDKSLVRYNSNLAKLEDLRSRIDELRKDRATFRDVVRNAEVQREKKDQEINRLISGSNEAYAERDRHKMELVRLKGAEATDVKAFEEKLERLNQTIEGQKIAHNHPLDHQAPIQSMNSQIGSEQDQQEKLTAQCEEKTNETLVLLGMKDIQEVFVEAERLERENFSLFNFVVEHGARRTHLQEEIDGLELQRSALLTQTEQSDEKQSSDLMELTMTIRDVDAELQSIQTQREKNESEFTAVYTEIDALFNMFECTWDESPDGKTTATPANAMFCLSGIESAVAEIMSKVVSEANMQCGMQDIKPSSFLHEDQQQPAQGHAVSRHIGPTRAVQEKELAGRVADSAKPLSREEMMAMLE